MSKNQDDRSSGVACTSRTDGQKQTDRHADRQTDSQTNRGDQYTLQKSTILQSNKQTWALQYLALPLWGAR